MTKKETGGALTKYRLIEIGRNKFSGIVEVANQDSLLREVRSHVMSREVDLVLTDGPSGTYTVIVGGYRPVGRIERIA
jgi:hypothetical protein